MKAATLPEAWRKCLADIGPAFADRPTLRADFAALPRQLDNAARVRALTVPEQRLRAMFRSLTDVRALITAFLRTLAP